MSPERPPAMPSIRALFKEARDLGIKVRTGLYEPDKDRRGH